MDFAQARHAMVESQLRTNRVIDDRLIAAFLDVPRERFVPKARTSVAYIDEDLPIGAGRFLLEPLVAARLYQLAEIGQEHLVLDVGSVTGYSTAILARLAREVVGLECDPGLASEAERRLAELGVENVAFVRGLLTEGNSAGAPYDRIVLEGAVAEVPKALFDQLGDGGRLVAVVLDRDPVGRGTLFCKVGGAISRRHDFDATVAVLPGFERRRTFVF